MNTVKEDIKKEIEMEQRLKIASTTANLHLVEKFVNDFAESCNVSHDVYGNLLIATLEAANNAITHGNKLDENKSVELVFTLDNQQIILSVRDEGKGFDYTKIPDPTAPENIENMSGRGVFLMTRLSDHIEFEDNGSFIKMTFVILNQ